MRHNRPFRLRPGETCGRISPACWRASLLGRMQAAAFVVALLSVFAAPASAQSGGGGAPSVDVALVLAVDVSRSMSFEELGIQRRGYAEAITSPEVLSAIGRGAHGRIAVTIFEWAGNFHAREIVPWTLIETEADARVVAARMLESETRGERRTSISGAIARAIALIEGVPYAADRLVIDISGDGPNNQGAPVTVLRDRAVALGITINGLPLMTTDGLSMLFSIPELDEYYRRCVIGGPGSFVVPVVAWDEFAEAVRRKLVLEIGGLSPGGGDPGADPADPWRGGGEARVLPAQFAAEPPYDCLIGEKLWEQRRWQFDLDSR